MASALHFSIPARCGVGVAFAALGLGVRLALQPLLSSSVPFITYFPAIAASTWLAGRVGGVTTTLVAGVLTDLLVIRPALAWTWQTRAELSAVLLFFAVGLLVTALTDLARRSSDRLTVAAEESRLARERLERVLDSIADGFVAVDRAWRYTYVNPAAERYFDHGVPELLGQVCWDVFPAARGTEFEAQVRACMRDGKPREFETTSTVHENAWVHVRVFPLEDGVSIYFRDNTAAHRWRRQIEESRAELANTNAVLQNLLERERLARADAEEANRIRDQSLATVSHELRTPLNAIVGWTELLKSTTDPDLVRRAVETIERNAHAQAALIGDLMDLSAMLSGKLRLDKAPIDVRMVVTDAVDAVRPDAARKGVHLDLRVEDEPVAVLGERRRLVQIAVNLLSNAIKFTPPDGAVTVSLTSLPDQAVLVVRDTGEGIDPAFAPFLFQPFRQESDGTTKRHGGLGLGLAIIRQMAELHGGAVTAESEGKSRGAVFTVTLPRWCEAVESGRAAHAHRAARTADATSDGHTSPV